MTKLWAAACETPPIVVDLEVRSEITGSGSLFIVQLTSDRPSPFSRPQIRSETKTQIRNQNSDHSSWKRPELLVPLTMLALGLVWKDFIQRHRLKNIAEKNSAAENSRIFVKIVFEQTLKFKLTAKGRHSASKLQRRKLHPTFILASKIS